jgi:hypothetical protein
MIPNRVGIIRRIRRAIYASIRPSNACGRAARENF